MFLKSDGFKWSVFFLFLLLAFIIDSQFNTIPGPIRVLVWIVIAIILLSIFFITSQGHAAWIFIKQAHLELRKVIWPSREETFKLTLFISLIVLIMALLLWGLDSFLFWLMNWFTSQKG